MTLFEAIRVLKPGQEIQVPFGAGASIKITWKHGEDNPSTEIEHGKRPWDWQPQWYLRYGVTIIDLPAPKMTPREGLEIACRKLDLDLPCDKCGASDCGNCSKEIARLLFAELSKLNIDWEVK